MTLTPAALREELFQVCVDRKLQPILGAGRFRFIDAGRFVGNALGDAEPNIRVYKRQIHSLLADVHHIEVSPGDFPLQYLTLVTEHFCGAALSADDIEAVYKRLGAKCPKTETQPHVLVAPLASTKRQRLSNSCSGDVHALPICDSASASSGALVPAASAKYGGYSAPELCEMVAAKDEQLKVAEG